MVDIKTTVFIHKIPNNVDGKTFISFVSKGGTIKVHEETGRRMAEMHVNQKGGLKEGIVTYECGITQAMKKLNNETLNGGHVCIRNAIDELENENTLQSIGHYNYAWYLWNKKIICGQSGVGGKGGQGGGSLFGSIFSFMNGQNGEPGEAGPGGSGGKGGKGGSCNVS